QPTPSIEPSGPAGTVSKPRRQPQHQCPNALSNGGTTEPPRVRPTFRHHSPMPAQQRRRRDEKRPPARSRQKSAGRRQEQPVGPGDRGTRYSSPQNADLVP